MRKILIATLLVGLTACVHNKQYRTPVSVFPPIPGETQYTLAFIEFDDMGEFWDRTQMNEALKTIKETKEKTGQVIVVTFVHGWKNNASDQSGNVWGFRDELKDIAKLYNPVPVIGIYIGWRGAATDVAFLKNLTFYNRRNAAIRIPGASMTEALHQIIRTTKEPPHDDSVCVLIGHSFGGMVLERALTQSMVSLINDEEAKSDRNAASIPSPADLIVFVNSAAPATEAKQFLGMLKARHYHYQSGARDAPFFLAITSKGDSATGFVMPLGQFPSKVTKAMREYDLCDPYEHPEFPPGIPSQSTYYLHSTANTPALQSHEIITSDGPGDPAAPCVTEHSKTYCIREKKDRWNDTPYWAMQMPVEIVPDHGTIFRPEFRQLLEKFFFPDPKKIRTLSRPAIPEITASQLALSSKIQEKRRELEAAWVRHKNEKEGQDALREAREILVRLKVARSCLDDPDKVFTRLRHKISDIVNDPSKVTEIAEAMGIKADQ
jgi:hypothetical protein